MMGKLNEAALTSFKSRAVIKFPRWAFTESIQIDKVK